MKGIQYVTDERGDKTAVMIDLKKHSGLWEDFYDSLIARRRKAEPREPIEAVRHRLMQKNKLRG